MAPYAGVIIAASVLVAAGIAVYESPEFREWIERSSQKVAVAFRSIGDDIHGRRRREQRQQDSSMHEDSDEKAEERRRQARDEIMERGKKMQESRKRRRPSTDQNRTPSFDSLVDEDGRLRSTEATSSGVDVENNDTLRSRNGPQMHESVDAPIPLRQLSNPSAAVAAIDPWESQYEQEMRNAWNIELPARTAEHSSHSHASESLIDLTPTTEDFPDPDYSIPSLNESNPWQRPTYFSAAASQHSHEASISDDADDVPITQSMTPLDPRPISPNHLISPLPSRPISQQNVHSVGPSVSPSMAGSTSNINHSEAEMTDDDLSEFGDGIRTPGSAWTEVASSVSDDDLGRI